MRILREENGSIMMTLDEGDTSLKELRTNTNDGAKEKHLPVIKRINEKEVEIRVNHVMEDEHYIKWILVDYLDKQIIKSFKPHEEPVLVVDYFEKMIVYSYCNIHGLWKNDNDII